MTFSELNTGIIIGWESYAGETSLRLLPFFFFSFYGRNIWIHLCVCPEDSSCLMSKHRLAKCPVNQICHAAMCICKCCCQFDSVLQLWAICITGYWACSSFKQVRTFPSCCVSHTGIIQIRLLHKCPAFYQGRRRVESGNSVCDFMKRDQKATLEIDLSSRNASAILISCKNRCLN